MRLLAVAAALGLAAVPPAAAEPVPAGLPCLHAVVHGSFPPDQWQGVLSGGPVAAPGAEVTVVCTVVDVPTGEVLATAASVPGPGVAAVVAPVAFAFSEPAYAVCTAVTVDGTAWTWDGQDWVPGPASCRQPPPIDPWSLLDQCMSLDCGPLGFLYGAVDETLCPAFAAVPDVPGVLETRDDGDVDVLGEPFYLCPPY
jgi:hypothetical protein